jgi:ribosomal protein L37E
VKWRCEWCGKPHPENDPPCDNCGHGEFEKAVVPAAPEGDDQTGDAYGHVWVCTECGNDHPKNTPPCDRCGHDTFERQAIEFDEDEVVEEMLAESTGSTTPSADIGYLDVLDTKLALGFVGVAALVVVFALGALGIVNVPGFGTSGPSVAEVPGNATSIDGLDIATVERDYTRELNDLRADAGANELERDERVASVAAFVNKNRVLAIYGDGEVPGEEDIDSQLGDACSSVWQEESFEIETDLGTGQSEFDSETGLARALADRYAATRDVVVEGQKVGVDVHVGPDGVVYVTQIVCVGTTPTE